MPESDTLFDEAYVKLEVDYGERNARFLLRKDEQVETSIKMEKVLVAPVEAGQQVGKIVYYLDGEKIIDYPLVVVEDDDRRDVSWVFNKILQLYLNI